MNVTRGVYFAAAADSLGTGMYMSASVLYFTRNLGLSAVQVGLGISAGAVVAIVGSLPIARLADRRGLGRSLVSLQLLSAASYASFLFASNFLEFVLICCAVSAIDRGWQPIAKTLVSTAARDQDRTKSLATLRVIRNGGFAGGGLVTGVMLAAGSTNDLTYLIASDSASFVVSAAVLVLCGVAGAETQRLMSRARVATTRSTPAASWHWAKRAPFLRVAALDSVCSLHSSILTIGMPVSVAAADHLPTWAVGAVYVVNTALVILLQRRVSGLIGVTVRRGYTAMISTLLLLAFACALLAVARGVPEVWAVVALAVFAVVLTSAELTQSSASWSLATAMAPYQGSAEVWATFDLGFNVQLVVGPLLIGAVASGGGLSWGVVAVGAVVVASCVRRVVLQSARRLDVAVT